MHLERCLSKVCSFLDVCERKLIDVNEVIGVKNLNLPLPSTATYFNCVLNNGIHFVETPASRLEEESLIDQEFELYVNPYRHFVP